MPDEVTVQIRMPRSLVAQADAIAKSQLLTRQFRAPCGSGCFAAGADVNPRHNACAAAKEFSCNVMGDARILRRELQNDPESRIALEETARFLGQLSQDNELRDLARRLTEFVCDSANVNAVSIR
jgi:hypothetical protein